VAFAAMPRNDNTCHDNTYADQHCCADGISPRRLLDYSGQLANEVSHLFELGIVMMIDRVGQTLDTLVVTDRRHAHMI
jgi:hypothetical protein